jgi:hypothetical protein
LRNGTKNSQQGGGLNALSRVSHLKRWLEKNEMITTNVYQRVFKIKYASSIGTCFTIEVDSKQYLITARHVVDGFSGTSLDIFHNNQWKTIPVCLVDHCSGEVDISVFAASIQLSPTY